MPDDLFVLSKKDINKLKSNIKLTELNQNQPPAQKKNAALNTYMGKVTEEISAIDEDTPGEGEVELTFVNSTGDLETKTLTKTVYNISNQTYAVDSYIQMMREPISGKYFAITAGAGTQAFYVLDKNDHYLTCIKTEDLDSTDSPTEYKVALPPEFNATVMDGITRNGQTFSYSTGDAILTADVGGDDEEELTIVPSYVSQDGTYDGDIVIGIGFNGSSLPGVPSDCAYLDMNAAGRAWARLI